MSAARVTAVPSAAVASTCSRPAWPDEARVIAWTVVPVRTCTPRAASSAWTSAPSRVDGGQHLGQLFHLGDLQAADGQGVGHLQADVPGADDDRAGRRGLFQGAHDGEGVAHRVQQVHPVAGPEGTGPARPRIGGRTGTAPVPTISLS
jgi:hypothetical protein